MPLYMTVITISTVGFSEIQPLSPVGRVFTSLIANIGIFAYVLAAFSYYVIQGEIFKNMHLNLINSSSIKTGKPHHPMWIWQIRAGDRPSFRKTQTALRRPGPGPSKDRTTSKSEEKSLYLEEDATTTTPSSGRASSGKRPHLRPAR